MDTKDKIVEKITKLITLTQDKTIKWYASSPENERIIRDEDRHPIGAVYTTKYKEKRLRFYKLRYKVEEPNPLQGAISNCFSNKRYPYWDTIVVLEFISLEGDSLWAFPYAPSLEDLFSAVQYQVADVSDFLNDI